jgi:hypothetical protein
MLLHIDEFPEILHHPKETELLFARVAKAAPETAVRACVGFYLAHMRQEERRSCQPPSARWSTPTGTRSTPLLPPTKTR